MSLDPGIQYVFADNWHRRQAYLCYARKDSGFNDGTRVQAPSILRSCVRASSSSGHKAIRSDAITAGTVSIPVDAITNFHCAVASRRGFPVKTSLTTAVLLRYIPLQVGSGIQ